jgi:hypothetical protein
MSKPSLPDPLDYTGRVCFHIGPHKTGTTSIQFFMDENYDRLLAQGILYPKSARRNSDGSLAPYHHPLVRAIAQPDGPDLAAYVEALRDEIAATTPRCILISSEALAGQKVDAVTFRRLADLFPKAERSWLAYLRRQEDLIISIFSEIVKNGKLAWPEDVRSVEARGSFDHLKRLEKWQRFAGTDPLVVRSFELERSRLPASVIEVLGGDPAADFIEVRPRNVTPPRLTIQLLRLANRVPGPLGAMLRRYAWAPASRLQRWGVDLKRTGSLLSETERRQIRDRYRAQNRQVEERYFGGASSGLVD